MHSIIIAIHFATLAKFASLRGPHFSLIALCKQLVGNLEKLSFSPDLPNLPNSPACKGPLLTSACGLLTICKNCNFRYIYQICHIRQLARRSGPLDLHCLALFLCALRWLVNFRHWSFSPHLPNCWQFFVIFDFSAIWVYFYSVSKLQDVKRIINPYTSLSRNKLKAIFVLIFRVF